MKKIVLLSLALILTLGLSAKKTQSVPKVVLIGIGEKNPTFNEAQYPDIEFYYTPGLVSQSQISDAGKAALALTGDARETFAGDPKFLQDALAEHNLINAFFVFDKSGVCYTHGYEIGRRGGDYLKSVGIDGKTIADAFKETMEKEKVAKESKKEMKIKKDDFMISRKLPPFSVVALDGSEVTIKSITENKEPVIIIFFQLSKDLDIQEAKKSGEGKTGKQFGKAMLSGAAGSTITSLCENIESQFFHFDAREK